MRPAISSRRERRPAWIRSRASWTTRSGQIWRIWCLLAAALTANGNALANIIIGTPAGNSSRGLDGDDSRAAKGDDTLTGNDEANTLDGKAGADTMTGGKGNDVYVMDVAADQIDRGADDGNDKVESTDRLQTSARASRTTLLGKAAVNVTGNDGGNKIIGTAGANILDGGTGERHPARRRRQRHLSRRCHDDKVIEAGQGRHRPGEELADFISATTSSRTSP